MTTVPPPVPGWANPTTNTILFSAAAAAAATRAAPLAVPAVCAPLAVSLYVARRGTHLAPKRTAAHPGLALAAGTALAAATSHRRTAATLAVAGAGAAALNAFAGVCIGCTLHHRAAQLRSLATGEAR